MAHFHRLFVASLYVLKLHVAASHPIPSHTHIHAVNLNIFIGHHLSSFLFFTWDAHAHSFTRMIAFFTGTVASCSSTHRFATPTSTPLLPSARPPLRPIPPRVLSLLLHIHRHVSCDTTRNLKQRRPRRKQRLLPSALRLPWPTGRPLPRAHQLPRLTWQPTRIRIRHPPHPRRLTSRIAVKANGVEWMRMKCQRLVRL